MAKPEESLRNLLTAELQQGYFTASFVECGYLDKVDPVFRHFESRLDPMAQVFDLASLTKALVTGPLVHQVLAELGNDFMVPLGAWVQSLPLPAPLLALCTEELLGHISGLPAWWNFWITFLQPESRPSRSEINDRLREVMLRIPVATAGRDLYSDVGYILLGYALEVKYSKDLSKLFQEFLREIKFAEACPLGFAPDLALARDQYISTGYCQVRQRELRGEVHDENCAALGGIAGHAGLFARADALGVYLKTLYRHPLGHKYLESNEQTRLRTSREGLLGLRRGQGPSAELFAKGQSMGHLGFTGTAFWIEWSSKKYAIFLSNRVVSGRLSSRMTEVRRTVFQHLDECLA